MDTPHQDPHEPSDPLQRRVVPGSPTDAASSAEPAQAVEKGKNAPERDDTAKLIAQVLLIAFISSFGVLLLVNITLTFWLGPSKTGTEAELPKSWLELLRNASILLSTALTTVIGYYFGQRDSARAREQARVAEKQVMEVKKEAKRESETKKALKTELAEVTDVIPTGMPEDFAAARPNLRKKPAKQENP